MQFLLSNRVFRGPNHRVGLITDDIRGLHDRVFYRLLLGMGGLGNEEINASLYAVRGLRWNVGGDS